MGTAASNPVPVTDGMIVVSVGGIVESMVVVFELAATSLLICEQWPRNCEIF